jgi:hypothetical protein
LVGERLAPVGILKIDGTGRKFRSWSLAVIERPRSKHHREDRLLILEAGRSISTSLKIGGASVGRMPCAVVSDFCVGDFSLKARPYRVPTPLAIRGGLSTPNDDPALVAREAAANSCARGLRPIRAPSADRDISSRNVRAGCVRGARTVAVELLPPFHHVAFAAVVLDQPVKVIHASAAAFGALDTESRGICSMAPPSDVVCVATRLGEALQLYQTGGT